MCVILFTILIILAGVETRYESLTTENKAQLETTQLEYKKQGCASTVVGHQLGKPCVDKKILIDELEKNKITY